MHVAVSLALIAGVAGAAAHAQAQPPFNEQDRFDVISVMPGSDTALVHQNGTSFLCRTSLMAAAVALSDCRPVVGLEVAQQTIISAEQNRLDDARQNLKRMHEELLRAQSIMQSATDAEIDAAILQSMAALVKDASGGECTADDAEMAALGERLAKTGAAGDPLRYFFVFRTVERLTGSHLAGAVAARDILEEPAEPLEGFAEELAYQDAITTLRDADVEENLTAYAMQSVVDIFDLFDHAVTERYSALAARDAFVDDRDAGVISLREGCS